MKKLFCVLFCLLFTALMLVGCGDVERGEWLGDGKDSSRRNEAQAPRGTYGNVYNSLKQSAYNEPLRLERHLRRP